MSRQRPGGGGSYRVGGFLLLAVALWTPSGRDLLHGTLAAPTAAVRLLAALLVAYAAVRVVTRVLDGYAAAVAGRDAPAAAPARRRDDPSGGRAQDTPAARAPEAPPGG